MMSKALPVLMSIVMLSAASPVYAADACVVRSGPAVMPLAEWAPLLFTPAMKPPSVATSAPITGPGPDRGVHRDEHEDVGRNLPRPVQGGCCVEEHRPSLTQQGFRRPTTPARRIWPGSVHWH